MSRETRVALVTGPNGIVGFNLMEELAASGWRAIGVGRSPLILPLPGRFISADLGSAEATCRNLASCSKITDLFFSAYIFDPDPYREIGRNIDLLRNTLDALRAVGAPLRHLVLYQGGKAYGAHLGPFRTPAKESDPRVAVPLFYYAQEDLVRSRAREDGFTFTVLRPNHILGLGFGGFVNLLHYIALYASVCKASGLPLAFPGGRSGYSSLFEMTDARLLARASIWATQEVRAQDETFNITNGDLVRWENIWPRLADYFGIPLAPPLDIDLAAFMGDKAQLWQDLSHRHRLQGEFETLANWPFASGFLSIGHDIHSSTIKIRRAGFMECLDSEERLFALLDELRLRRLIPPGTSCGNIHG